MSTSQMFKQFVKSEKTGGIILIFCTLISLVIANSILGDGYHTFWSAKLGGLSVEHWINDGLMAIFFLLIGLELKREIYVGELSRLKDAAFPIFGALGGMVVPAGIFLLINYNTPTQSGAGIPMATDIAFALGILSLLGSRVPTSLKVFLTALAVIDDLGAIIIIAVFYSQGLMWVNLLIALAIFAFLLVLNRMKVHFLIIYLLGGIAMWYFMLHSGVHATITGILLAFAIPFHKENKYSLSYALEKAIHYPVAFLILPLFALANTAIFIGGDMGQVLGSNYGLGIALGLIVGKPVGIFLFTFIAAAIGWCVLPKGLNWKAILGVALLGGIGFTMSIFITLLAFEDALIINNAKLVILLASLVAGILGYSTLSIIYKKQ